MPISEWPELSTVRADEIREGHVIYGHYAYAVPTLWNEATIVTSTIIDTFDDVHIYGHGGDGVTGFMTHPLHTPMIIEKASAARMWDVDDLASTGDLGKLLHVTKGAVGNWVARRVDFPAPIATVGGKSVYSITQVRAWRKADVSKEWRNGE